MTLEQALSGKTLVGHKVAPQGASITFYFEGGHYLTLEAEGECCSRSWIESIDQPEHLQGQIYHVEQLPMRRSRDDDGDTFKYYGLKIVTERGHAVIDYRNHSNGYYGGSLEIADNNLNISRWDDE